MGRRGREAVAAKYTWAAEERKLSAIYRNHSIDRRRALMIYYLFPVRGVFMNPTVIPKDVEFREVSQGEVSARVCSSQASGPTPVPSERKHTRHALARPGRSLRSLIGSIALRPAPGRRSKSVETARMARLPYVVRKAYGVTSLSVPRLTPWLGPWIAPSDGKYAKQLGAQHELLRELVRQLPKAHRVFMSALPSSPIYMP